MEELKKEQEQEKKATRASNETVDTLLDNEEKIELNKEN